MIHGDLTGKNVHLPYSFEYADIVARDLDTSVVAADIGKLSRVLVDNTLWMLTSVTPVTWSGVASGTNTGSTAVATSGSVFPAAPSGWELFYRTDLNTLFIWNMLSSAWVALTSGAGTGDMIGANNLADVSNVAQAVINLGLSNVNNTSDLAKPISNATASALLNKEDKLGNPTVNGQVLTSDAVGNRTWVTPSTGGVVATSSKVARYFYGQI